MSAPNHSEAEHAYRNAQSSGAYLVTGSTKYGALPNFDAHKPSIVHIAPDPQSGFKGFTVDLSTVTPEDLKALTNGGRRIAGASSNEQLNEIAADTFAELAVVLDKRKAGATTPAPVPSPTIATPPVAEPPMPARLHEPRKDAAAYFGSLAQTPEKPTPVAAAPKPRPAPTEEFKMAERRIFYVTYQRDGYSPVEVPFHDVLLFEDRLVLVRDSADRGMVRHFPPDLPEEYLFVDVHDHADVYLVKSLGILFPFMNYEFCVLLVEKAQPKDPAASGALDADLPFAA